MPPAGRFAFLAALFSSFGQTFYIGLMGMIRGVYASLMVLSTAAGPVVLGGLLEHDVALATIGAFCLAYVVIVPPIAASRLRPESAG